MIGKFSSVILVPCFIDFSLLSSLDFFVDLKNGTGRNKEPPAIRVADAGDIPHIDGVLANRSSVTSVNRCFKSAQISFRCSISFEIMSSVSCSFAHHGASAFPQAAGFGYTRTRKSRKPRSVRAFSAHSTSFNTEASMEIPAGILVARQA